MEKKEEDESRKCDLSVFSLEGLLQKYRADALNSYSRNSHWIKNFFYFAVKILSLRLRAFQKAKHKLMCSLAGLNLKEPSMATT